MKHQQERLERARPLYRVRLFDPMEVVGETEDLDAARQLLRAALRDHKGRPGVITELCTLDTASNRRSDGPSVIAKDRFHEGHEPPPSDVACRAERNRG